MSREVEDQHVNDPAYQPGTEEFKRRKNRERIDREKKKRNPRKMPPADIPMRGRGRGRGTNALFGVK